MRKLAERIKYLRESNEMTLMALSEQTGISKSTISRWENDEADIRGDNLIVMANYFKVTTDYLLGVTDF